MSDYRKLSTDEVIGLTTINCCANAIRDNEPKLRRRLGDAAVNLTKAADLVAGAVEQLIEGAPDADQRQMIINRMSRLKLQFGHTRQHPEELVIMSVDDAQTLLAPLFDRCDIDCPCCQYGEHEVNMALVKQCETRKALNRIGVSETGLGGECKYQYLIGGKKHEHPGNG